MSKNICSKDLIIDAENSIIDLEGMQEQIKELEEYMNNQTYLAMHKHDIWQGSRGYYYTYLPDPVKGRILLKKKSKNDLTTGYPNTGINLAISSLANPLPRPNIMPHTLSRAIGYINALPRL